MTETCDTTITGASIAVDGVVDVLNMFRNAEVLTRSAIVGMSGLSRSTVTQRIHMLMTAGLITAGGPASTKGRPAESYSFNRSGGFLLVADIGATGMRAALCDLAGGILAEQEASISIADGPEQVLDEVDRRFAELTSGSTVSHTNVLGIGISVPGPVDTATGQVVNPPIMPGWDRYDIPAWFSKTYECPVIVDKDANPMAFGEQRRIYPESKHLLMIKIGTGVGAGLVSDGCLHRGANGAAGDIGHNYVRNCAAEAEPECRCGNTGCLEAYAGGWALLRELQATGRDVASVDDVVNLIRSGDPTAVKLARQAGRALGEAIAVTVNLFNPTVVAVGGQLALADQQIIAGIREAVYRRSLPLATRNLKIVRTELGPQAGVIGLAILVSEEVFSTSRITGLLFGDRIHHGPDPSRVTESTP